MKKITVFFVFISLLINGKSVAQSSISGISANGKPVKVYRVEDGKLKADTTVTTDKNGHFSLSVLPKEQGEFFVIGQNKKHLFPVFVKQNDKIDVSLGKDMLSLQPGNSAENRLLYQWQNLSRDIQHETLFYKRVKKEDLTPFPEMIKKIEVLKQKATILMAQFSLKNSYFGKLMQAKIDTDIAYCALYSLEAPRKNRLTTDQDLPKLYTQIIESNPFDDDYIMSLPNGSKMLFDFAMYDYFVGKKRSFKELYSSPALFAEVTLNNAVKAIEDYAQYERFLKKEGDFAITPLQKKRLADLGKKLQFSKPNIPAPDFILPDQNDKMHKLSDYKGSVVVIDVWATWCAPCKKEMPFLKKLEEELQDKNVTFIAICVGAAIEKNVWKKMIEKEKPAGIQLFSGSWTKGFSADYKIKGVPRFMVFDKKGAIVSINAPRPSTPALKHLIERELDK